MYKFLLIGTIVTHYTKDPRRGTIAEFAIHQLERSNFQLGKLTFLSRSPPFPGAGGQGRGVKLNKTPVPFLPCAYGPCKLSDRSMARSALGLAMNL